MFVHVNTTQANTQNETIYKKTMRCIKITKRAYNTGRTQLKKNIQTRTRPKNKIRKKKHIRIEYSNTTSNVAPGADVFMLKCVSVCVCIAD